MYLNILKRDLKRKKTMNMVLLLFAILAAMFVSSGVSNVVTVMNGTEYFLDKAGVGDYMVITQNGENGVPAILEKCDGVKGYKKESFHSACKNDLTMNNKKVKMKSNTVVLQGYSKKGINYFHTDNTKLESVKKGEVYITAGFLKKNHCEIGDTIKVNLKGSEKSFRIAGEVKDAFLGSDMMGNIRLILNEEDYREYYEKDKSLEPYKACIFYINSTDIKGLASKISGVQNVMYAGTRQMTKLCYVMEMLVAMIVLVLSVVLCIVSFVLLRFVINFTIGEEFREIGVMKAIGIGNGKIRSLYMTKYLFISLIGGSIGLLAGIPFGKVLIQSVSEKMFLGNDSGILLNLCGTALVIFIMSGFAYLCTAKIKRLTPLDAIRDGQTGERYGKRIKRSFKKSRWGNALHMAVNDIISAPKRFIAVIVTFFICSVFVFGVVLVCDTMRSDRLIETLGKRSDVYITDSKILKMELMSKEGNKLRKDTIKAMEKDLEELHMPGDVSLETWYRYAITVDGETVSETFQQNKEAKSEDYAYTEGTPLENANEIAITPQISDKLGIEIGDTVTVDFGTEKRECIVVSYFQTLNQMGQVIKLHEDAPTDMKNASAMMAFQIDFHDEVNEEEVKKRIQKLKEFYDIKGIFDAAGFCDDCMGVADTMETVANLLLVITCIVIILVTVLMERSFISDETSQIALLKAIGFKDSFIMRWHMERFMIVAIAAELLAILLTYPVTKLWADPIWRTMGCIHVDYYFKPLSLLVIFPGIILLINFVSIWLTAGYTRKIVSNDVRNIE